MRWLGDEQVRAEITATTNNLEAYSCFSKWLCFGGDGTLPEKQSHDQEKRIKYTDLVANAVILQNTVSGWATMFWNGMSCHRHLKRNCRYHSSRNRSSYYPQ